MSNSRPPLRPAAPATSPPHGGGEETPPATSYALPLPSRSGGEVAPRSGDGVGEQPTTTRSRRRPGTTKRARQLRQGENEAEALLWLELKRRKLGGHKFTRQFPIGPYFADFCCRKRKLVVEIDGSQHAGNAAHDRRRDEFMRDRGFSTLRFWNTDVRKQRKSVCQTILAVLDGRLAENVVASDLRFVFAPCSEPESLSPYTDLSP